MRGMIHKKGVSWFLCLNKLLMCRFVRGLDLGNVNVFSHELFDAISLKVRSVGFYDRSTCPKIKKMPFLAQSLTPKRVITGTCTKTALALNLLKASKQPQRLMTKRQASCFHCRYNSVTGWFTNAKITTKLLQIAPVKTVVTETCLYCNV